MKIKKYYQYIKENLTADDLKMEFVFLSDLGLNYGVMDHLIPNFGYYDSGNSIYINVGIPGQDMLLIFDHEYKRGFYLNIDGEILKGDWEEFYTNFATIIYWLKDEGYTPSSNFNDLSPEEVIDFFKKIMNNEIPTNNILLSIKGDVIDINVYFYFELEGSEFTLSAKEMADRYEWSYQKTDGKNVWIKYSNSDLVDDLLHRNEWHEFLKSDDVDWDLYDYYRPDVDMMGDYTSKNITDKLKSILDSEERYDSRLWKEFKEKYPDEYEECQDILGDIYYTESAYQQKSDIVDSWESYLEDIFENISKHEDEEDQWLIMLESKWFIHDGINDYDSLSDVLEEYLSDNYFNEFRPRYRDYPDISSKMVEDEWLPILNKIKK